MGEAAVAASAFAFSDSSPPHGLHELPLSLSDTPSSGWLLGVFGYFILSSFVSSPGLNVTSPSELLWPSDLDWMDSQNS